MRRSSRAQLGITALVLLLVSCRTAATMPARDAPVTADLTRLAALHHSRASAIPQDYPIGPGDLIGISVPAMPELRDLEIRVGADGAIALPLLGRLEAGGRTEHGLRDALHAKISEFMFDPEFSLLVKEHRNRQVGVLGAVARPGLHLLDGPADTVLDLLSKAGGLTDDATRRVLLLPRPTSAGTTENASRDVSAGVEDGAGETDFSNPSIVIDLDRLDRPEQQLALSIPLRPGDTLMALGGGKVFLRGWVEKPGAIEMSRGLTVLGAITEAGGFSFPAKPSAVRVLREEPGSGARRIVEVDIAKVQSGVGEDLRVREGDVVEVDASSGRLALYGVYRFITGLINVGLSLSPL